jgi:RNA polymerase sigma-70 factor (ECF subfamily)
MDLITLNPPIEKSQEKSKAKIDSDEFADRAERIKQRLYRAAYMYLGSESMATDAVDEAIYRGFISLNKLRQPEYLETWLTRILINQCKKELRRKSREEPLETLPEAAEDSFDSLPLKDAVRRLPPELKEVIILRFFTGFTQAETAKSLDIPQGTVVTRQRRALKLLKLELE